MERFAVVARLQPGAAARAVELAEHGPPFDPGEAGFDRHAVFLSEGEVVFEGEAAEWGVEELLNDPVRSAAFGAWGPLLEGSPRLARGVYFWRRTGGGSSLVQ